MAKEIGKLGLELNWTINCAWSLGFGGKVKENGEIRQEGNLYTTVISHLTDYIKNINEFQVVYQFSLIN